MSIVFYLLIGTLGGVAGAIQGPVNGALGKRIGPLQATLVSFTGALIIITCGNIVYALFSGQSYGLAHIVECEPWMLLGGPEGAFVVLGAATCTPRLGVALTATLTTLGQMTSCLLIDAFGLLGTTAVPTNPLRVVGILVFLAGVVLVHHGQVLQRQKEEEAATGAAVEADAAVEAGAKADAAGEAGAKVGIVGEQAGKTPSTAQPPAATNAQVSSKKKPAVFYVIFMFICGVAAGIQLPTNVALQSHVGLLEALLFHFTFGSICILTVVLITQKGKLNSLSDIAPWKMTGGVCGVIGLPIMIFVTPVVGTALNSALMALGQLAGGLLIDAKGLLQVRKVPLNAWRIAGVCVLVVSIILVAIGRMM